MPAAIPAADTVRDVVKQLDAARDRALLQVDGHDLSVSNLDKPLSTLRTVPDRLEAEGDPWDGILAAKQDLGAILEVGGAA